MAFSGVAPIFSFPGGYMVSDILVRSMRVSSHEVVHSRPQSHALSDPRDQEKRGFWERGWNS